MKLGDMPVAVVFRYASVAAAPALGRRLVKSARLEAVSLPSENGSIRWGIVFEPWGNVFPHPESVSLGWRTPFGPRASACTGDDLGAGMSFIPRLLIFFGLMLVLYFGTVMVGGGILGVQIGLRHASDPAATPQLAAKAAYEFAIHYRPIILAAAVVISAFIAFGLRWSTALISIPVAVLGFLWLRHSSATQPAPGGPTPKPGALVSKPARAGRQATLLRPLVITIPYGHATLPKGTVVTVLSDKEKMAIVEVPNNTAVKVPLTHLK